MSIPPPPSFFAGSYVRWIMNVLQTLARATSRDGISKSGDNAPATTSGRTGRTMVSSVGVGIEDGDGDGVVAPKRRSSATAAIGVAC